MDSFVKLFEEFEEDGSRFLVCEFCGGGTLEDLVKGNSWGSEPARCLRVVFELGGGVFFLHKHGVTHRDLKTENILVGEDLFKIADFGLANDEDQMESFVGTPLYIAPEILQYTGKKYDNKVDIWSLGVILFNLLTGDFPFYSERRMKLFHLIIKEPLKISKKHSRLWSPVLKNLLKKCLEKKPGDRLSIEEFLDHRAFEDIRPQFQAQLESISRDVKENGISDQGAFSTKSARRPKCRTSPK